MELLSELLKKYQEDYPFMCLMNANGYKNGFQEKLVFGHEEVRFSEIDNDCYGILNYDLKDQFFSGIGAIKTPWISKQQTYFFKSEKELSHYQNDLNGADVNLNESCKTVFSPGVTKAEYIRVVNAIRERIHNGTVYELNYCIPFYAEDVTICPISLYQRLNFISPVPFSALLKLKHQWVICASPERFLKKEGSKLLSQPIKGTIGRSVDNDEEQIERLQKSEKERAENLMIVDLVRHDLNQVCEYGSVNVDELFGIYTFPQVHQMISTISGDLKPAVNFQEIMSKTFPMGSMTGAPKRKALELINQYEQTSRGLFSGAIGGIDHTGDFDFNVVIRSLVYDERAKKLFFMVGSAITYDSDPEAEYEECLLKASAIQKCFE